MSLMPRKISSIKLVRLLEIAARVFFLYATCNPKKYCNGRNTHIKPSPGRIVLPMSIIVTAKTAKVSKMPDHKY